MFVRDVVEYLAGWVIRKLISKIKCTECIAAVTLPVSHESRADSLLQIQNRGGLIKPSDGLVKIIFTAERLIREIVSSVCEFSGKDYDLLKLEVRLLEALPCSQVLFPNASYHFDNTYSGLDSHYFLLIRCIARTFFTVRFHHLVSEYNSVAKPPSVRQKLTKAILFAND